MDKLTHSDTIAGIALQFEDRANSLTVPYVFGELKADYYGLNQVDLSPEDTVIDIGANVGMFSIYVKKRYGCKVIAFEPVPQNFEQLKKNIVLNGLSLDDFELHNCAITDVDGGEITIGSPDRCSGSSSAFYGENLSVCKTETLDKYITPECKYLKIDCEGGEYVIIPAILDKLNQFSYIGIEFHKYNEAQDPVILNHLILDNFKGKMFP